MKPRALFWTQWVLRHTTVVALVIAIPLGLGYIPHTAIGWSTVGVCLSLSQQAYLRRYLAIENWGLLSAAGWIMGVIAGKAAVGWTANRWDVDWALIGLIIGSLQVLSLRKYGRRAVWWILVSSAALVLAGALGGATALLENWFMSTRDLDLNRKLTEAIGYILAGSVGAAVYAAVTGGWLVWFIKFDADPQELSACL